MFLKRVFYASASILMLAGAYHLGASTAGAQSGAVAGFHISSNGNPFVSCPSGDVWIDVIGGGWRYAGNALTGRPGRTIVGLAGAGSLFYAILDNGDIVQSDSYTGWNSAGNAPCGTATSTATQSFGSLKAKYR